MTVVTTRVDSTIKKTEQKAKVKWHLRRFRSLHWYLAKNLAAGQLFIELSYLFWPSGSFKLSLCFL